LMFAREQGTELYLGQGIPRYWLSGGRKIGIERAATHFGPLSLSISTSPDENRISANFTPPRRDPPRKIYLRLRHPQGKPIKSVTLHGKDYDQFDAEREWIVLPGSLEGVQEIIARY